MTLQKMQFVEHPGPVRKQRWRGVSVPNFLHQTLQIPQGQDLFEYLEHFVLKLGVNGASFRILAGQVDLLSLQTGGAGSETPMTFHGPFEISTPAIAHAGAGIIGKTADGDFTTHCHAVFRDRFDRLVGGHLIRGKAIAGKAGLKVKITGFVGATFVLALDEESSFTIFHPELA